MRFNIRQEHIASGKKKDCEGCPVAMAATEQMGRRTMLFARRIIDFSEPPRMYPLPESVVEWVERFDAGEAVEPITFEAEEEIRAKT